MAPMTRRGQNTPTSNTNPKNMTPESVQAMIDQALQRNSTNGDASHSSHGDDQRNVQTVRPCFYADFMKCQPLNFKVTEGMVGLTWGCLDLVEWSDKNLRSGSIFNDLGSTQEEDDGQFVSNETEKVDKYISGFPNNIYGNVKSARPKTLDETIELANNLMDQKLRTYAERQFDNKRKADDSSRNNHGPRNKLPFKRQNFAKSTILGDGEKSRNEGKNLPKCTKCHFYHNGPCTQKCHKCNKVGHFARDYRSSGNTNVANTQKGNGANPKGNGNAEKKGNVSRDLNSNVVTDLMPVELGSFDIIIGMDWLRKYHAVIAQEYMAKSCQIFLAQISAKKEEDKLEGKKLKDVPIARDFLEVFPEDLPGLPPARPMEFQINLIPGVAPVARAPYRLALSEMKELSEQLQEISDKGFIRPSSSP
ncbi:hypothetical protein Tco_1172488 [Tanacetum coccineum]